MKTKIHRWEDVKRRKLSPQKVHEIETRARRDALEMSLKELRKMLGKTQAQVSTEAAMAQGELSKMENREDHRLSTLRRYIKALGGDLEVVAVFDDKRIRLHGV